MLSRVLTLMPLALMVAVRDRHLAAKGWRRPIWAQVVRVLRHRPLTPMTDFALPDNPALRLVAVHSRLTQLLFWYGERGWEGSESEHWRRLCTQATKILEIGANVGYYTVQGASAAPHVPYITVEANPESAKVLRENIRLNDLANVTVIEAAVVGDAAPPNMRLALPDGERYAAPTGAYLATGTEGITDRPASRAIEVNTMPAARLIDGVDLIKLDVEGYEAVVLEAVWPYLLATRPTIVVEVLTDVPRLRALIRKLHAEGYQVDAIGADRLHRLDTEQIESEQPLPRYGSRDIILSPSGHG
jgi:FkbM family methyltransferase